MRISLATRAARASLAATILLSLSLSPSFARMGGSAGGSFGRPAFGTGHFSHFAPHGFNRRFDAGRFSFNRFGPGRFDHFGFNRFTRVDRFGNQLFVGGWGWGGWGGYSAPAATPEPIIAGDGAPVFINIGAAPAPSDAYAGGCVIHKLNYDANGKYVGERQIPLC